MSDSVHPPLPAGREHLDALVHTLSDLRAHVDRIDGWAQHLAVVLPDGGRLLVAGNGGSAAQAQHLTSELVGRYRDDRPPVSAIALHADTSSLTAISNDYGAAHAFARQVEAHGRAGDVLVVLSTSGRSSNVVAATVAARRMGLATWALTGPAPNPLASRCDDAVCVNARSTATVQEAHQVIVHLLCAGYDVATGASAPARPVGAVR
jgi:D-sedoheptulose 7-phosphate isomerase